MKTKFEEKKFRHAIFYNFQFIAINLQHYTLVDNLIRHISHQSHQSLHYSKYSKIFLNLTTFIFVCITYVEFILDLSFLIIVDLTNRTHSYLAPLIEHWYWDSIGLENKYSSYLLEIIWKFYCIHTEVNLNKILF